MFSVLAEIISLRRMNSVTSDILKTNEKIKNTITTNDLFLLKKLTGRLYNINQQGHISYQCTVIIKPGQTLSKNSEYIILATSRHCYINDKKFNKVFILSDEENTTNDISQDKYEIIEVCVDDCSKFIPFIDVINDKDNKFPKIDKSDYGEIKVKNRSTKINNGISLYEKLSSENLIRNNRITDFKLKSKNTEDHFDIYFLYGTLFINGYENHYILIPNIIKEYELINENNENVNGNNNNKRYLKSYINDWNQSTYKITMSSKFGLSGSPFVGCMLLGNQIHCKIIGTLHGGSYFNNKQKFKSIINPYRPHTN